MHTPPSDILVRMAGTRDRREFAAIDPRVASDLRRRELLDAAIAARNCWVAERAGRLVGYGVLSTNFFGRDCIELLYVAETMRRHGVGNAVLRAMERACRADRIFASTTESNSGMRALLEARDYRASGTIHNLKPGDTELVFVKFLQPA